MEGLRHWQGADLKRWPVPNAGGHLLPPSAPQLFPDFRSPLSSVIPPTGSQAAGAPGSSGSVRPWGLQRPRRRGSRTSLGDTAGLEPCREAARPSAQRGLPSRLLRREAGLEPAPGRQLARAGASQAGGGGAWQAEPRAGRMFADCRRQFPRRSRAGPTEEVSSAAGRSHRVSGTARHGGCAPSRPALRPGLGSGARPLSTPPPGCPPSHLWGQSARPPSGSIVGELGGVPWIPLTGSLLDPSSWVGCQAGLG